MRHRRLGIAACIATATIVTATLGLTWPFLSIVLERQGEPGWVIGLSASVQMAAVLLIAPLGPRIIGWLGTTRCLACGLGGIAVSLALLPVFPNVWAWFPIRFCLGFFAEIIYTVSDIWINQLARERTRGRLLAFYSMFLSGGFALGPVTIVLLGTEDWTVLYVGIGVGLLGLVPVYLARHAALTVAGKPRARLLHYLATAPTLMVSGLMFGLIDSATFSLLPLYGLEEGLTEQTAALLLTMFVVGSVAGQLPLGWLADTIDRRKLLAGCVAGCLVAVAALPFALQSLVATWLVMIVIGLTQGSFYLVSMAMIGSRYRGVELIGINASFVFLWGLGMVVGPTVTGGAMDLLGTPGFPLAVGTFCVMFLALVLRRIRTQPADRDASGERSVL